MKRASVSGGPYITVADNLTGTSYTDTNLTTEATYYYIVSARGVAGVSTDSQETAVKLWFIPNGGFEAPVTSAYSYNPSGGAWTFSANSGNNGSGLVGNGSAFSNPTSPEGKQAAFFQGTGTITQAVTGLTPGVTYTVSFSAAQRGGTYINGGQTWNLKLDGTSIGSYAPGPSATMFVDYTTTFTATAVTHTLAFAGTNLNTGDNTAFIDNVRMAAQPVSGLAAIAGNARVVLSWQSVAGASGYNVKRSLAPTGTLHNDSRRSLRHQLY